LEAEKVGRGRIGYVGEAVAIRGDNANAYDWCKDEPNRAACDFSADEGLAFG
jgi:hypothetical protein